MVRSFVQLFNLIIILLYTITSWSSDFVFIGGEKNSGFEKKSCGELNSYFEESKKQRIIQFEKDGNYFDCTKSALMQRKRNQNGFGTQNAARPNETVIGNAMNRVSGTLSMMSATVSANELVKECYKKNTIY